MFSTIKFPANDIAEQIRYLRDDDIIYIKVTSLIVTDHVIKVRAGNAKNIYDMSFGNTIDQLNYVYNTLRNGLVEDISKIDISNEFKLNKFSGKILMLYILQSVIFQQIIKVTPYMKLSDENKFKVDRIILQNEIIHR